METQSNLNVLSKTKTIVQCCIIAAVIALAVSMAGKINIHEFWMNILDWQTM